MVFCIHSTEHRGVYFFEMAEEAQHLFEGYIYSKEVLKTSHQNYSQYVVSCEDFTLSYGIRKHGTTLRN